jgi:hypothetical protein
MTDQAKVTIEITSGHCLGGADNDVYPGDILEAPRDLSIAEALKKVRTGYARIVPNPQEAGPEVPSDSGPVPATVVTHGDPVVNTRDPEVQAPHRAPRGRPHAGRR